MRPRKYFAVKEKMEKETIARDQLRRGSIDGSLDFDDTTGKILGWESTKSVWSWILEMKNIPELEWLVGKGKGSLKKKKCNFALGYKNEKKCCNINRTKKLLQIHFIY